MLAPGPLEILLPDAQRLAGHSLLGEHNHLGDLTQLGESLDELSRRAFTLAGENPGWIAPSQLAVAQRLTESARTLLECSQLILRHRDAVQGSVDT